MNKNISYTDTEFVQLLLSLRRSNTDKANVRSRLTQEISRGRHRVYLPPPPH